MEPTAGPAPDHSELEEAIEALETPEREFELRDVPAWLRPLVAYQRRIEWLTDRIGAICKYLVLAVVAIGFVNALLRYAGQLLREQLTSNRYIELQWYLYAAVFLLAFAYILKHGINVRVDFWYAGRSDKTKAAIDFAGHMIGLVPFCLLGLWVVYPPVMTSMGRGPDGGWRTARVWEIWEQSPDPGGLPRAPVKALLLVGLGLLLLQALAELVKLVAVLAGHGRLHPRQTRGGPVRIE